VHDTDETSISLKNMFLSRSLGKIGRLYCASEETLRNDIAKRFLMLKTGFGL
jgi:hypothetical protein